MLKAIFSFILVLTTVVLCYSQGTLQFNQVKIINNTVQTIPAGKVWKATSVYGQKFACWEMYCPGSWPNCSLFGTRSGLYVNGTAITIFNSPYAASSGIYYQSTTCSGSQSAGGPVPSCLNAGYGDYINPVADRQTILPLWLPAGTTVQSFDSQVFVSVIEFNIIP